MVEKRIVCVFMIILLCLTGCSGKISEDKTTLIQDEKDDITQEIEQQQNDNQSISVTNDNVQEEKIIQNSTQIDNELKNINESNKVSYDSAIQYSVDNQGDSTQTNSNESSQVTIACDNSVPAGGYMSWVDVNNAAQKVLIQTQLDNGWVNGKYNIYTNQNECGSVYYTFDVMEFK